MRRLRLLGPARVDQTITNRSATSENVDGLVPRFRSRRTIALLGYLVAERRPVARDFLAALFWPDEEISKGRANLSRELHNLGQILPECWVFDRQTVAFTPSANTVVDLDELVELEAQKHWVKAANCLVGEFLEGLALDDNAEFENWLFGERERWRERSAGVLKQVIDEQIRRGHYLDALQCAQRLLQKSIWDEGAHQYVMRLMAWTGQRSAALRQYEICKQVMREELGVEPSEETAALYQQIQAGDLKRPPQLPGFLTEAKARHKYTPTPCVGREDELAKLSKFFAEVMNGKSRIVFISGGPGRGKTTLLDAFSQQAMEMNPTLLVVKGNCNAYTGLGDPYLPYLDAVAMLTGDVEARWDAGAISREHASRLWEAFPMVVRILLEYGSQLLDVFVPCTALLSRSIAIDDENKSWLPQLAGIVDRRRTRTEKVEQNRLFQQITDVLRYVTCSMPMLLFLDDFQWADAASISLLFHLGRRLAETESRLLIACAYRPEEVSVGRNGERHPLAKVLSELKRNYGDIWVDLGRKDKEEDRRFVDALLDIEPNRFEESFRAALFNRTGGHPLFTVELLRAMQEQGKLLKDSDGLWIAGPTLDWEVIPARVEAVIEERTERLDPKLRKILYSASVEGEVFTVPVLAEILNVPETNLLNCLSRDLGRRHRLVIEQEDAATNQRRMPRYKFSHILYQDYLYKQLDRGERRKLHGEIAAAQEKLYQGQLDEMAVHLAHHYHHAGNSEKAFEYYSLAGERAARLYDNGEAIKHYTNAINLSGEVFPDSGSLARLYRGRGLAFERLGSFKKAVSDYTSNLQIARKGNNEVVEWRATLDLGKLWASRDYYRARYYFDSALEIARRSGEPALLADSLNWKGNWYANDANPREAVKCHLEALKILEDQGDQHEQANTLDLLGLASLLASDPITSVEYYNRSIPMFRELNDHPRLVSSLLGRASTVVSLVYLSIVPQIPVPDAMRDTLEGLRIAQELDLVPDQLWGLYSLGSLSLIFGEFGQAMDYMISGVNVSEEIGHREYEVGNRFSLGLLYAVLFNSGAAVEQFEIALILARELCSQTWIQIVSGALAGIYIDMGDLKSCQASLEEMISPQSPMDTLGRRSCWVRQAELALLHGDPSLALDITEKLIKTAPGFTPGRVITFLWWLKGKALTAMGDAAKAITYFQAAIENARITGERYLLWQIHASLGDLFQNSGQQDASELEFLEACRLRDELAATIPDENLKESFLFGVSQKLNCN